MNTEKDKMNTEKELIKLTKDKLLSKCTDLNIKASKTKKKDELIDLILNLNLKINDDKVPEIINLKPLVKWSGGKADEIKLFKDYIPDEYNLYLEPFFGGGAVFFNLQPKNSVISDVHSELIDFYKSINEGKSREIYDFMDENKNNEETYYKVRDNMEIKVPLDNAKRFYYLRKTCFRGMLRYNKSGKFNIPYGKYKTINYNDMNNNNYENLLKKSIILNKSYEYIFENYNDENNFMFLDPPYDSEFTDYGYCQFGKDQQIKLSKLFKETRIKCLMIIGKTDFIEDLYKDYIVGSYDKSYKFKLYGGRIGDNINTKHLIIKNY
jgi:DNA adenine methylase